MLISLNEYKLLTLGKVTFRPGKFKIIVPKRRVQELKSNAILHETGYFSPLWLNTEFSEGKPNHINIAYVKIKGTDYSNSQTKARAYAKLNSTANLLYNAAQIVVLSGTEICCIFSTYNYNKLDYLLSTQNSLEYKYQFNVNRKDGFRALESLKEQVKVLSKPKANPCKVDKTSTDDQPKRVCNCKNGCNHSCGKKPVYLDPQVAVFTETNAYEKEEE